MVLCFVCFFWVVIWGNREGSCTVDIYGRVKVGSRDSRIIRVFWGWRGWFLGTWGVRECRDKTVCVAVIYIVKWVGGRVDVVG